MCGRLITGSEKINSLDRIIGLRVNDTDAETQSRAVYSDLQSVARISSDANRRA